MIFARNPNRTGLAVAGILVAAVFFVAINALSSGLLRGLSLDFTEGRLFTLSDGTRKLLAEIDEPVTLRLFYSPQLGEAFPAYSAYSARIRELLERYKSMSNGMIRLEIYSPEPFSDDEDQAVSFGMNGIAVNAEGDTVYLGLAGSNSTDDEKVIPFLHIDRERFLEYDLTRMVADLANPKRKIVGLISGLPIQGRPGNPMLGPRGGGVPAWQFVREIEQQFEIRNIAEDGSPIAEDVDVLMLVHPIGLDEKTLYAIDQYVLGGGKVVAFVDPHAEAQQPASPMMQMPGETSSSLPGLLEAWGVDLSSEKIVGDKDSAIRVSVPSRSGSGSEIVDYLPWMSFDASNIDADDVVTADISRMIVASAGAIRRRADATTEIKPLLFTGRQAMEFDTNRIRFTPDPMGLWADFESADEVFVVAARISGVIKSAFPDGPPKSDEEENAETDGGDESPEAAPHLAESTGPINIILVADTDLLRDQFWVQMRDFFGQQVAVRTSGNADFVVNAIENLSGSDALIGLRSRGDSARPFALVRRLQQDAEDRYRKREQELETKLSETEKKLSTLQTGETQDGEFILSQEQEQAIDDFRGEMVVIRKDLRNVQRALRRDIDRLDAWLKFVNIGLVPLLVGIAAIVLGILRRKRRRQAQTQAA